MACVFLAPLVMPGNKKAERQGKTNGSGETDLQRMAMGLGLRVKGRAIPKRWSSDEVRACMHGKEDEYLLHASDSGDTALHSACAHGGAAAAAILKEWAARKLPLDITGHNYRTPLSLAAASNQLGVGRALIRAGCDANRDALALGHAIASGADGFVILIVRACVASRPHAARVMGAPELLAVEDAQGRFPLHIAAINGRRSRGAEILIDAGADLRRESRAGKVPSDYVSATDHVGAAVFARATLLSSRPWAQAEHALQPWPARVGLLGLLVIWHRIMVSMESSARNNGTATGGGGKIAPSARVRLSGLRSAPHLNGKVGTVVGPSTQHAGRWDVRFDDDGSSDAGGVFKLACLEILPAATTTYAHVTRPPCTVPPQC